MSQITGWKRKALLLFKSEKRLGAKRIVSYYTTKSYEEMKQTIISDDDGKLANIQDVPRIKDLSGHLDKVKKEFIGKSELCYYHATLVVLLRRDYKPEQTFKEFEQLWSNETDYLLNNLSVRWIISGCDTFIDHSNDAVRNAILMNAITMINTLKVYETKQFLQLGNQHAKAPLIPENVDRLYEHHLPLYDGLTYFRIGSDDTLKHMRQRYERFYDKDELATTIVMYIFDKLQTNNSAFSTLRALHRNDKSKWWLD